MEEEIKKLRAALQRESEMYQELIKKISEDRERYEKGFNFLINKLESKSSLRFISVRYIDKLCQRAKEIIAK